MPADVGAVPSVPLVRLPIPPPHININYKLLVNFTPSPILQLFAIFFNLVLIMVLFALLAYLDASAGDDLT